jgi:lipopolysaccharide/colanic/teichoic acid biosynthesis glycosyltransferase
MDTYLEKRAAPRIDCFFHARCEISWEEGKKVLNVISEDVSEEGIRVFSEEPLPLGAKVSVVLNLVTNTIKTDTEVVWCNKDGKTDQFLIGMSFSRNLKDFTPEELKKNSLLEYGNVSLPLNNSALKRLMDIILSSVFLFLSMPLLLLVCLFIKIDSPGPILFKQWRAGKGGKRFLFYKFRSMFKNVPSVIHREYAKNLIVDSYQFGWIKDKAIYKLISDSRITKVGNIIRKLSIDEIPQFLNVLKGEMSIVGPRPPIFYELEFYLEKERKRLMVKPGITRLWQISGRSSTTFAKMVELDLEYMDKWSLSLDIKIMLKTAMAIFRINEAY